MPNEVQSIPPETEAFASFFGATAAGLVAKSPVDVANLIARKISDQAIDSVAGLGIAPDQLPASMNGEGLGETFKEKLASFTAMPAGKEKDAFYEREIAPTLGKGK